MSTVHGKADGASRAGARRALVLGAGISGLAAAHRLRREGWEVTVLEASERAGGTFSTVDRDGFRFELGPNTVLRTPDLEALCDAAGVGDRLHEAAPEAKKRYLLRDGTLVALPGAPPGLLTTPLLSWRGKLRALSEPWRRGGPEEDESVTSFVVRRFGTEVGPLVDAMVTGVHAGDPAELVLRRAFPRLHQLAAAHGGSVLRGLRKSRAPRPRPVAYRGGFGALARDLAKNLDVRTACTATSVRGDDHGFEVAWQQRDPRTGDKSLVRETVSRVVTALPAGDTAAVLDSLDNDLDSLANVPHAPVAVLGLGLPRSGVDHPLDGFGFLAPHAEGCDVLGCLFVSTLFPDTAPADHVALVAMIGGRRRPGLVGEPDDRLRDRALAALRPLLGLRVEPVVHAVARWRPGIPQGTLHTDEACASAERLERAFPGLEVLGNWRHGPGVPDCIRAGWVGTEDDRVDSPPGRP